MTGKMIKLDYSTISIPFEVINSLSIAVLLYDLFRRGNSIFRWKYFMLANCETMQVKIILSKALNIEHAEHYYSLTRVPGIRVFGYSVCSKL